MANSKLSLTLRAALIGGLFSAAPSVPAADDDVAAAGKERFMDYCAVCHGADATGGGPVANVLKQVPTDLTQLAKNNDGHFPFGQVYDTIDGRRFPAAHGSREMPVWGGEWKAVSQVGAETEVRGRILEMIIYLRSIQK